MRDTFEKLRDAGYVVTLNGDKLKLEWTRNDKPDPEIVKPLLDELKTHKDEAIQYLLEENSSDPFTEMFKKATAAINRRYITGTEAYIEAHHPALHKEISQALNELDEAWSHCNLEEFRTVLKNWYLLNVKAIETYDKQVNWFTKVNELLKNKGWCVIKADILGGDMIVITMDANTVIPAKWKDLPRYTADELNSEINSDTFKRNHKVKKAFKARHIEDAQGWPWVGGDEQ